MNNSIDLVDFHRNCFTIIADDAGEHKTFLIPFYGKEKKVRLFCSCTKKSYAQCDNSKKLLSIYEQHFLNNLPTADFEKSFFWSLIEPVTKIRTDSVHSIKINDSENGVSVMDRHGNEVLRYYSNDSDRQRFISRICENSHSRFTFMNRAAEFVLTDQERALLSAGHKTQRQIIEESFWYRMSYHCYREFNNNEMIIEPGIDEKTGRFTIEFADGMHKILCIDIPSESVPLILQVLHKHGKLSWMQLENNEYELYFQMKKGNKRSIIIEPIVIVDKTNAINVMPQLIHGSYLFVPGLKKYIRFSYSSLKLIANGHGKNNEINSDEISDYLEKNEASYSFESTDGNQTGPSLFDDIEATGFGRIIHPSIISSFDRIELNLVNMDKSGCVLEVAYCSGQFKITLSEIFEHKKKRDRFIFTDNGIADLESEQICRSLVMAKGLKDGKVSLSNAALLQFRRTSISTVIEGEQKLVAKIKQMLEFKPLRDLLPIEGINGSLREYQRLSVQWMLFLYDNSFGGLLCDDMGLGKTIQIIALFMAIKEQRTNNGPFMVICPTSVISHWKNLLLKFAPSLRIIIYHTADRESLLKKDYDVLLTSYGIMRNDMEKLQKIQFDIMVFDEVHQLKNKETMSFQAAVELNANVKLGVTGTPIENSISDLKTLFNLVIPGLLNKNNENEQFLNFLEGEQNQNAHLKKIISPFIMRRLKETVLKELPLKIEDVRSCTLTNDQYVIYSETIKQKCKPIIEKLKDSGQTIPYMHIFSLLSFLKQVCNHPALAIGKPQDYEKYQSGKWDLFTELLDESLESGQKIVVFSQYLGMVDIISMYLHKRDIGHVVLTGSTSNREQILKKFAEDKNCRVFVGSLKAGGVGIDLISASVLIHYDRWWNPARENQATDRVHRIGQKRGVQVFKFVTEETIEQRIDAIIESKKHLSESILSEDSADSIKIFTRDELIKILSI